MCAESPPIPDFQIFTGDVSPFSFSPNMVRKTVKLMGPGASFSISSSSSCFTLRRPVAASRKVINVSKPKEKHWKTLSNTYREQQKCPSNHSCLWSHLCSGPWWWRPEVDHILDNYSLHNLCVLFIGHLELYACTPSPPLPGFNPARSAV